MEQNSPKLAYVNPTATTKRRGGVWAWFGASALILLGASLLIYPFWPKIEYAVAKKESVFPYTSRLTTDGKVSSDITLSRLPVTQNKPAPKENRLVIPSIGVDMLILEGATEKTLDRGGIWHIPKTSNPSLGSNTVFSGHRWQYLPPSGRTLYLLDKVKIGEPIIVYWEGKEYDYRVSRREVVDPSRTDIQDPTDTPQLTIFTCTPIFSTKQRLVLYGEFIS